MPNLQYTFLAPVPNSVVQRAFHPYTHPAIIIQSNLSANSLSNHRMPLRASSTPILFCCMITRTIRRNPRHSLLFPRLEVLICLLYIPFRRLPNNHAITLNRAPRLVLRRRTANPNEIRTFVRSQRANIISPLILEAEVEVVIW